MLNDESMHLHNYETVELYAQSDGGAFAQATVKHINVIIIWYHMHDVEMLGLHLVESIVTYMR